MSIAIHWNSLFYNSSLSSCLLGTWAKKQYLYKINIYTSTALCYGVGSCRSYMIFNSFNGGGGGGGVKTTNEYQNFATVDGFSIFTLSDSYGAD